MKQLIAILIFIVFSSCGDNSNNPNTSQYIIEGKVLEYDSDNDGGWILYSDSETIKVDRNLDPNKAFFTECFGKGLGNYNFAKYYGFLFENYPILTYIQWVENGFGIKRNYKNGFIESQQNTGEFFSYVPSVEKYITKNDKLVKKINESPDITYNFTYNENNYIDTVWKETTDPKSLFKVFEHDSDGRINYEIDENANKKIYEYDNAGMINKISYADTLGVTDGNRILNRETIFKIENERIVELEHWSYSYENNEKIGDIKKYKLRYNELGIMDQLIYYDYKFDEFEPQHKIEYVYE